MFEDQVGRNQMALMDDPLTKKGCELWLERVLGYYGEDGGVEVEVIDGQLALTEKTADYICSDFTPLEIEHVLRPTGKPTRTDDEMALELWDSGIHQARLRRPPPGHAREDLRPPEEVIPTIHPEASPSPPRQRHPRC